VSFNDAQFGEQIRQRWDGPGVTYHHKTTKQ
jgi:hypothetical protein